MSDMQKPVTRRSFLKAGLILASATPVLVGLPKKLHAQETLPAVNPEEAQPKALGYVHDAAKVDTVKWTKKAQADGDKQKCSTCVLYQGGDVKVEGHEGQWGKCALFPGKAVAAEGWCNSWALKPGA